MKIQNLAVIFIIIIMPISIVLSTYTGRLIDVAKRQSEYDSILLNSTYDSIRAFQMNTLNNAYDEEANSKTRDINASINSFFNSLAVGLSSGGYTKNELTDYIPAILYTLYDGYYVYSVYDNIVSTRNGVSYRENTNINNKQYGLKPYTYYSCTYSGDGYNLVINYTLDNYITVTGNYLNTSNGRYENVALSGYYIDFANTFVGTNADGSVPTLENKIVTIDSGEENEIVILPEILGEYLISIDSRTIQNDDGSGQTTRFVMAPANVTIENGAEKIIPKYYNYITYNNIKYYFDDDCMNESGSPIPVTRNERNGQNLSFNLSYDGIPIFFLDGNKRNYINQGTFNEIKNYLGATEAQIYNKSGYKDVNNYYYYYNASNFSKKIYPILSMIDLGQTTDETGNRVIASNLENMNTSGNVITTESYHIKYTNDKGVEAHVKTTYPTSKVFDITQNGNNPEEEGSSFNMHRMDVIITSIQSSIISAIANFDEYTGSSYQYTMPVLTEEEWDRISNNLTVATFMQGLAIENFKYYNSYAVVANTKTKDFVSKESIYIQSDEQSPEEYHNPRCINFNNVVSNSKGETTPISVIGHSNLDYDRKECNLPNEDGTASEATYWYYPQSATGSYECIVGQNSNMYLSDELISGKLSIEAVEQERINKIGRAPNKEIRRAYISALAREKGVTFNTYKYLNMDL